MHPVTSSMAFGEIPSTRSMARRIVPLRRSSSTSSSRFSARRRTWTSDIAPVRSLRNFPMKGAERPASSISKVAWMDGTSVENSFARASRIGCAVTRLGGLVATRSNRGPTCWAALLGGEREPRSENGSARPAELDPAPCAVGRSGHRDQERSPCGERDSTIPRPHGACGTRRGRIADGMGADGRRRARWIPAQAGNSKTETRVSSASNPAPSTT